MNYSNIILKSMKGKIKSIFCHTSLISITALLFLASFAVAEETPSTENFTKENSEEDDFQRFSAIPALGYTEETELEYGAMLILFFKPDYDGGASSSIDFAAYGTTKKQFEAYIEPRYYFFHDKINGEMSLTFDKWTSLFYGIGNNPNSNDSWTYDQTNLFLTNTTSTNLGLPKALQNFMYGISFRIDYSDVDFKDYDGDMEQPETYGSLRTGFGYQISYDSRDNDNWAKHGFYAHWQHLFFTDAIGDCNFTKQELDLRGYTFLFWKTSMAVGVLWQRTEGDVPFDLLAGPDGSERFRGVEYLYFRDNQALIIQTELRKVLFWRLAGTIFFEGGKTGKYFSDLLREKWHRSIGFGGELGLNLAERLYVRGDFSWIDNEEIGLTISIRQAF